ncbi:hypothetical protein PDESU_05161 [Pontiella desulfatans]|uniref:Uncharacterized protein n=1 Tax=Pontiella desulfatans TaxID=2750659 RepID=A0A6C2U943_PONDE|nr:hypothetical protein PDESU_05161 [Pontiella desulfatans]
MKPIKHRRGESAEMILICFIFSHSNVQSEPLGKTNFDRINGRCPSRLHFLVRIFYLVSMKVVSETAVMIMPAINLPLLFKSLETMAIINR